MESLKTDDLPELSTPEPPLTETEAAQRLGLKVATLRAWRHQHRGPVFVQLGRAIRYLPADLDAFLRANRIAATRTEG